MKGDNVQITDVLLLVVEREGKDGLHGRTLLQRNFIFYPSCEKQILASLLTTTGLTVVLLQNT